MGSANDHGHLHASSSAFQCDAHILLPKIPAEGVADTGIHIF
jgi:hypothetical protein